MNEAAEYVAWGGIQSYRVTHRPARAARAGVLLVGPMGLERTHAHASWVRWARTLAAQGYHVLRFDLRGTGESGGRFEDATLGGWEEDTRGALEGLRRQVPGVPLALHGLRLGGLLAARLFARAGDALLLWDPPESARAHLMETLRRKLAADFVEQTGSARRTRDQYVQSLEAGQLEEVEGYPWTRGLWKSAEGYGLALPGPEEQRPWRVVHLDGRPPERCVAPGAHGASLPLPRPAFWQQSTNLVPALQDLFGDALRFLGTLEAGRAA